MDVSAGRGPRAAGLACVVIAACSGSKTAPKAVAEDAKPASTPLDATVVKDGKGDVQIRVEWKDVPAVARAAPGRTSCGTPRAAAVAPTTTWGIPEVFVALDANATGSASAKRVVLADCALTPRVVVAGGTLTIASGTEAPAKLSLQRAGKLPLGSALTEEKPRDVYVPTAGHEVAVALDAGAIYRVTAGEEVAWVVASDSPFVAITEATGNVVMRGVPSGTYAVTAWLPPRSGQSARVARGKVTVNPGALAEVTVDITAP